MLTLLWLVLTSTISNLKSRRDLALENLALRQNPYVERVIGTIRREFTDHLIITGKRHLLQILRLYVAYYNAERSHDSLGKDAPDTRPAQPRDGGTVIALPRVGGLHHRYEKRAA